MKSPDEAFLRKLRETFRIEAAEHVQDIGAQLLRLERQPPGTSSPAEFEPLFRTAHNLKGAARAVGAREIETICHEIESIVQAWRRAESAPVPGAFDAIHQAVELISTLLAESGREVGPEVSVAYREVIAGLNQQRGVPVDRPPAAAPTPPPPPPAPPPATLPVPPGPPAAIRLAARSGSAPMASVVEPTAREGAAPVGVRVPLAKLEQVLQQSEELLGAKQTLRQHRNGLQELQRALRQWDRRWLTVQRSWHELERGHRRARPPGAAAPDPAATDLGPVLDFLAWTESHLREVAGLVRAAEGRARRDELGIGRIADSVLENAKSLLMLPAASVLEGLPLLARQLARSTGKQVEIEFEGAQVEIDNRVLGEIRDALVHLVRNALDHGIEPPSVRSVLGKPATATLQVHVVPVDGNNVEISVSDDGRGIDPEKVRRIAVDKGFLTASEAAALDDTAATQLIFESGFSSSQRVTDLSGRGLGLAIVAEKAQRLGGRVTVESEPGRRTRFTLLIPITLAAFRGLVVAVRNRRFVLAAAAVERVARVRRAEIRVSGERQAVTLGGRWVGVCELAALLGLPGGATAEAGPMVQLVLLGSGEARIALLVDAVLQEEEVLVRKLAPPLARVPNIAGATLLASGELVPVLQPADLQRHALETSSRLPAEPAARAGAGGMRRRRRILVADDSMTSRAFLRGSLEAAGYDVVTAVDGLEALEQLRGDRFDLLVSDVEMPRLSGLELTARIRADRRLAELPVVLVTSLASDADRARGLEAGASAYLVKDGFDRNNLLELIGLLT